MKLKLSIIIPAYNASPFIEKCLNSLITQDIPLSDYEIIVINDGSTDNTAHLLDNLKESIFNLIVLNQSNSGQSVARNKGLDIAKGKYIFFVDSDDYIAPNCLNKLITLTSDNKLDALQFNYNSVYGTVIESSSFKGDYDIVYDGERYFNCHDGIWSPCVYIFSKRLFDSEQNRFVNGITSEDIELLPRLLYKCSRIMAIKDSLYFYVYNDKSTTKNRDENIQRILQRIKSQFVVLENNFAFFDDLSISKPTKEHLKEDIIYPTFTAACAMLFQSQMPFSVAWTIHNKYIKSRYFPIKSWTKHTFRMKIMYSIMNCSFYFILFYKLGFKHVYCKYILNHE